MATQYNMPYAHMIFLQIASIQATHKLPLLQCSLPINEDLVC